MKKFWYSFYNRVIWPIAQLFPFKYHTTYGQNGETHVTVWRMWFGRCFWIEDWVVKE